MGQFSTRYNSSGIYFDCKVRNERDKQREMEKKEEALNDNFENLER